MMQSAVLALDMQLGLVTPQNQDRALAALRAIESFAFADQMPLVVASYLPAHVNETHNLDERLWFALRHHEDESLLPPLSYWGEELANTLLVERDSLSAWTSSVKHFLRKYAVDNVIVVGLNSPEILAQTISDIIRDGISVTLMQNCLTVSLTELPISLQHQVTVQ